MVSAPTGQRLEDPEHIEAGLFDGTPTEIGHSSGYRANREGKIELQADCAPRGARFETVVFTRTKHGASRLTQKLAESGIVADGTYDAMRQSIIGS